MLLDIMADGVLSITDAWAEVSWQISCMEEKWSQSFMLVRTAFYGSCGTDSRNSGRRGENNLAQRISDLHGRYIERAQRSAYIRIGYVFVYKAV